MIPPIGASQDSLPDNYALAPVIALTAIKVEISSIVVTSCFNPAYRYAFMDEAQPKEKRLIETIKHGK